jgi:hypothetical protein
MTWRGEQHLLGPTVGVPSLSAARAARGGAAQPIGEALEGPGAVGDGPLVFALLDGLSEDATVVYIGVAKRGREAIAEQAAAAAVGAAGVVVCAPLPRASRRPQLQAAWKAWVTECGYLPQGNQPPSQPPQPPSQPSPPQRTEERGGGEGGAGGAFGGGGGDWQISALAAALAAVTEEAVKTLCDKGYVAGLNQGLTLVHFSAQLKRFLRDKGYI